MITNILEKKEEIRKLWLEKVENGEMKTTQFYKEFLGDYFDVASFGKHSKDWWFFLIWIRDWKKKIKKAKDEEEIKEKMKGLTDEQVEEIQDQNRKKMIVILSKLIANYEELPEEAAFKKTMDIAEIRRMYSSIQSLEEKIKMTDISKGKLKLEAVRTLLPYQRMPLPEILKLKEKLNESFDRIIKLKSGESVGPDAPVNG